MQLPSSSNPTSPKNADGTEIEKEDDDVEEAEDKTDMPLTR